MYLRSKSSFPSCATTDADARASALQMQPTMHVLRIIPMYIVSMHHHVSTTVWGMMSPKPTVTRVMIDQYSARK